MKSPLVTLCLSVALGLHAPLAPASEPTVAELTPSVPAGTYRLDRYHASLLFRVSHMGFSNYTARFTDFDVELQFDPRKPTAARLTATVDTNSIETDFPFPEEVDFDQTLRGADWLNTTAHPQMTYRSSNVVMTGPSKARIEGELTFRGVTQPMTLQTIFNGGYPGMSMDPNARIGFSAHGTLKRSAYGMVYGIPEPGSNMGVGDEVEVIIEAEFIGPAFSPPAS